MNQPTYPSDPQLQALARAILDFAREHGLPNTVTPGELYQRHGAPAPLATGRLLREKNFVLTELLARENLEIGYYEHRLSVDKRQPQLRLRTPEERAALAQTAPERHQKVWEGIRSLEAHTPQAQAGSAAYRAWDQARTPDLPLDGGLSTLRKR